MAPCSPCPAVMVSAGFVHLLGDAIEDMGPTEFPVAPLLCATGLLMTIIADSVASNLAEDSSVPAGCCGADPPPPPPP